MSFVNNLRLREFPKPKQKIKRKIEKLLDFDDQLNAEREKNRQVIKKSKEVITTKENEWKNKEKQYIREINQKEIGQFISHKNSWKLTENYFQNLKNIKKIFSNLSKTSTDSKRKLPKKTDLFEKTGGNLIQSKKKTRLLLKNVRLFNRKVQKYQL